MRTGGVAVCALLLGACSAGVEPVAPEPQSTAERSACDAFLADLPSVASDAALTCGAPEPTTLTPTAECDEVRGVGWFLDPDELNDPASPITATAVGVRPRIAVVFAAEDRGQRSLEVLSALADPVLEHLERISPCQ